MTEDVARRHDFPCVFGTRGFVKGLHAVSALNFPYSSAELASDMKEYLDAIERLNAVERGLTGLLVYFEPLGPMNLRSLQVIAWDIAVGVREFDDKASTGRIVQDISSSTHAFSFLNELWFVNFSSSGYTNRRSRNLGNDIALAMQTFRASDGLFKGNKSSAQKMVRQRAEEFDGIPAHPGLGPISGEGEPTPVELSYFIGDSNSEDSFEPWKYRRVRPKSYVIEVGEIDTMFGAQIPGLSTRLREQGSEVLLYTQRQPPSTPTSRPSILVSRSPDMLQAIGARFDFRCLVAPVDFTGGRTSTSDFTVNSLFDLLGLHLPVE